MSALHTLSATTLVTMMKKGDVSVSEVTDAFLARIAAHNTALNAFTYVSTLRSRRRASALDSVLVKARKTGDLPTSPIFGLPVGIKDLYLVQLMPFRGGSRALGRMVAPIDSPNVKRLRAAGVVVTGKLATAEFGAMPFTEPETHGPTVNPWDTTTTAGGSSGGTASALAAGLVPLGHGSDGGGSIRIPAAMCALFGFKAGRGALHHGSPPEKLKLSTEGPLARTVDDAVAMLQVLATDARFQQRATVKRGLRVRLSLRTTEETRAPLHPTMERAARQIAAMLEDMGHFIDDAKAVPRALEDFVPLWQRTLAWVPLPKATASRAQPITRWLREAGKDIDEASAFERLARIMGAVDEWWGDADLVVSPTVSCLPPKVGSWKHDDPETSFIRGAVPMAVYTAIFNASGQPAISIPVKVEGAPQPVGVQVVAKRGDDALLIAVARALEEALGGFNHRPPGFS